MPSKLMNRRSPSKRVNRRSPSKLVNRRSKSINHKQTKGRKSKRKITKRTNTKQRKIKNKRTKPRIRIKPRGRTKQKYIKTKKYGGDIFDVAEFINALKIRLNCFSVDIWNHNAKVYISKGHVSHMFAGANGEVYKIRVLESAHPVYKYYALKIRRMFSDDELWNLSNISKITHVNILKIISHGNLTLNEGITTLNQPRLGGRVPPAEIGYIISEWVQGLVELGNPLPYGFPEKILLGICNGVKELQRHNMVHTDIKPENIGIKGDTPCLIDIDDLYVVRSLDNTTDKSGFGGTPQYTPPESQAYEDVAPEYVALCDLATLNTVVPSKIDVYSCGKSFEDVLSGLSTAFEDITRKAYYVTTTGIFMRKHKISSEHWMLIQQDLYPIFRFLKMFKGYTTRTDSLMFSLKMCDTLRQMTEPDLNARCSIYEAIAGIESANIFLTEDNTISKQTVTSDCLYSVFTFMEGIPAINARELSARELSAIELSAKGLFKSTLKPTETVKVTTDFKKCKVLKDGKEVLKDGIEEAGTFMTSAEIYRGILKKYGDEVLDLITFFFTKLAENIDILTSITLCLKFLKCLGTSRPSHEKVKLVTLLNQLLNTLLDHGLVSGLQETDNLDQIRILIEALEDDLVLNKLLLLEKIVAVNNAQIDRELTLYKDQVTEKKTQITEMVTDEKILDFNDMITQKLNLHKELKQHNVGLDVTTLEKGLTEFITSNSNNLRTVNELFTFIQGKYNLYLNLKVIRKSEAKAKAKAKAKDKVLEIIKKIKVMMNGTIPEIKQKIIEQLQNIGIIDYISGNLKKELNTAIDNHIDKGTIAVTPFFNTIAGYHVEYKAMLVEAQAAADKAAQAAAVKAAVDKAVADKAAQAAADKAAVDKAVAYKAAQAEAEMARWM